MTIKRNLITIRLSVLFILFFIIACGGNNNGNGTPSLNSKVIMIGDSYFAVGDYIANELENLSGEIYRHYYMGGATMGDNILGITPIPNQYVNARAENAVISTVIMDGGGNDVLFGGTAKLAQPRCLPINNYLYFKWYENILLYLFGT
jgi:hypothetical protein